VRQFSDRIRSKLTGLVLPVLLTAGCDSAAGPSPLYPSYFLSAIDNDPLPVPFAEDGSVLLAGSLGFGDGEPGATTGPVTGLVSYSTVIRRPDQSLAHSTVDLDYTISDGVLRINLCPPLALCILSTELVGPVAGRTSELVLTHYLAGSPTAVYRFFPSLPD